VTLGGGAFDPGLQAERTVLAWRRTALALAVAAVGAARLAAPALGPVALLLGAVGLLQAVVVAACSSGRYRSVPTSIMACGDLRDLRRPALPLAALAASGFAIGVLALAVAVGA
jgi:putative membrane protein